MPGKHPKAGRTPITIRCDQAMLPNHSRLVGYCAKADDV